MGLGGLIDVAEHINLDFHDEDIGIALAYHGVPPGPYLVLPILGPSNLRDAFGKGVEIFLHPLYWVWIESDLTTEEEWGAAIGTKTVEFVDVRSRLIEAVRAAKGSSLDYYLFTQSAYYQYREGLLHDGSPPGGGDDWLENEGDWEDEFLEGE